MMPKVGKVERPVLVNRGAAGLLKRLTPIKVEPEPALEVAEEPKPLVEAKYRIAPALQHLAVPIDSIHYDPVNARLHPDRNKEAIRDSFKMYGQTTPLVVQKSTMKVVAGNGRLEVAREMGWTEIAVTIIDMTDVEAAGYGLADNRTAELAKWDFEIVAKLDKLLLEAGHDSVGWSKDELEVLRMTDWTPPTDGVNGDGSDSGSTPTWNVLVVCKSEEDQLAVIEQHTKEGRECRALIS